MPAAAIAPELHEVDSFLDGAPFQGGSGRFGIVWNPATGEAHAQVGFASARDVDGAVDSAARAFPAWRATPLSRRAEVLFRFRNLIEVNREELARIIATENGKTLADARGEIARGLENVEYACGIPALLRGGYTEQVSSGVDV